MAWKALRRPGALLSAAGRCSCQSRCASASAAAAPCALRSRRLRPHLARYICARVTVPRSSGDTADTAVEGTTGCCLVVRAPDKSCRVCDKAVSSVNAVLSSAAAG
eukprot:scaffold495_cov405-Prasinococcus_capsulatus_cf.AAC.16